MTRRTRYILHGDTQIQINWLSEQPIEGMPQIFVVYYNYNLDCDPPATTIDSPVT